MMLQKSIHVAVLFAFMSPTIGFSAPKGASQLHLHVSSEKRLSSASFSSLVSWDKDETTLNRANGLASMGDKSSIDGNALRNRRGVVAQFSNGNKDILIENKNGFSLTRAIIRDHSNQALRYHIPNKTFNIASVAISIDLVESGSAKKSDLAHDGLVTVTVDGRKSVEVHTQGKSTKALEMELALALGGNAYFSSTPIYSKSSGLKSSNDKTFDGGEVKILRLNANSITVDVNDPRLGVLTKFSFPETSKRISKSGVNFILFPN
jgi:hypothetical protein